MCLHRKYLHPASSASSAKTSATTSPPSPCPFHPTNQYPSSSALQNNSSTPTSSTPPLLPTQILQIVFFTSPPSPSPTSPAPALKSVLSANPSTPCSARPLNSSAKTRASDLSPRRYRTIPL